VNLYKLHTNPESLLGYEEAMKDPDIAWGTHENNHDKLRELENLWTKSAEYSYYYARDVLKNRFPKGEDIIATDAHWSYEYAEYVLKPLGVRGFPQGEDAIATDALSSYLYAKDVLKDRFPQGEDAIATNANNSYWYARDVLEDRFPKGEAVIRGSNWQASYEHIFGIKLSL
jgi:hypothetical protein